MQLDSSIIIENNLLAVELYTNRPVIKGYIYKPNDEKMTGAGENGVLVINNTSIQWNQFDIKMEKNLSGANYNISLPNCNLSFDMSFTLKDNILSIELENIQDPKKYLKTVGWENLPMLVCDNTEYSFWRLSTGEPDSSSGGKMWMRELSGQIKSSEVEDIVLVLLCLLHWRNGYSRRFAGKGHRRLLLFALVACYTLWVYEQSMYANNHNT